MVTLLKCAAKCDGKPSDINWVEVRQGAHLHDAKSSIDPALQIMYSNYVCRRPDNLKILLKRIVVAK